MGINMGESYEREEYDPYDHGCSSSSNPFMSILIILAPVITILTIVTVNKYCGSVELTNNLNKDLDILWEGSKMSEEEKLYIEYVDFCKELKFDPIGEDGDWKEDWKNLSEDVKNVTPLQVKYNNTMEKIRLSAEENKKLTQGDYKNYISILAEIGDPLAQKAKKALDGGEDPRIVMFKLCETYRTTIVDIGSNMEAIYQKMDEIEAHDKKVAKGSGLVDVDGKTIPSSGDIN